MRKNFKLKDLTGRLGFLAVIIGLVMLASGCGGPTKSIQIKGSDTMVNLVQAWAENFMQKYPQRTVAVTGGGSGTGIAALFNRTTDIAMTSRDMEPDEIKQAEEIGLDPREFKVAADGIAIVVNPNNPIKQLTLRQLSSIFTSEYSSWKEVGGADKSIVVLSRDRNSGTHLFFLEHVVKLGDNNSPKEFGRGVLLMPSNQAIVEEVAGNTFAIGYIGLGYVDKRLKVLAVAKDSNSPFVLPDIETVSKKVYPIARSLNFYTNGSPTGEVKSFIDFTLSSEGQKIVQTMDFVPLAK